MGRFNKLEVGDKVLRPGNFTVISSGWGGGYSVRVVYADVITKVSNTQATTESGVRFMRDRGNVIGAEGFFYPDGWINPDARDAIGKKPMQATAQARLDELAAQSRAARRLHRVIHELNGDFVGVVRNLAEHSGKDTSEVTALLSAALEALRALRGTE